MNYSIKEIEKALEIVSSAEKEGLKGYEVLICENGHSSRQLVIYPRIKAMGNDYEFIYALNENYMNEVFNMKKGESMYFQPIRDDDKSKGIITRIM